MKLIVFLILIFTLQASADASAQRVSISVKNQPLKIVLKELRKQSGYSFIYGDQDLKRAKHITLQVNGKEILEILPALFKDQPLNYSVNGKIISIKPKPLPQRTEGLTQNIGLLQQHSIVGRVTDEKGNILEGVTVRVKGTNVATTTDPNGNYEIRIPDGADTLTYSIMGFEPFAWHINEQTVVNVSLKTIISNLDEVVVIGYGVTKKSDLTGAVVRADLTAMQNSPNVNIGQALKGVVPGLNVGTTSKAGDAPSITIRGRNTISGTTAPLIVLDGIIFRGSLTDINPSDIESVDILKDASSAAVYGSQASNGVMMITTKTAQTLSKPIIQYSGNLSAQQLMNSKLKPLGREGYLAQLANADLPNSRTGTDLLEKNPEWNPAFFRESVASGYLAGTEVDWMDLMSVNTPYIQNHNASVQGKNELASYFLSFGYTDQQNLIINDKYKRHNVRVNIDAKITDWLKIGSQSFFTSSDVSGENPSFYEIWRIGPLSSPYNADGNLIDMLDIGSTNPLLVAGNPNEDVRYNLTGNFYSDLKIPFIKGLSYRLNYSRNLTWRKYFSFDPYVNGMLGAGSKNYDSEYAWTLDNILSYQRNFGLHAVNATMVYGSEKRGFDFTDALAKNFTNQTLGYNYLQAGQGDQNEIRSGAWEEASLYAMARVGYTYNSRYILTATIRRDGFSGFGKNYKIGHFPSVAMAWQIGEERFIKDNLGWIDNLKIRTSYGSSGNRTGGRYATLARMSTEIPFKGGYGRQPGGYLYGDGATPELTQAVSTMSNHDLRWESTTSLNIGLDFSLLDGRLFGSYDHYRSNTQNLLYELPIPNMNGLFPDGNGVASVTANIGKLRNVGHEFSISGLPIRNDAFEWQIGVNFSRNRNKVVSILGLDTDNDGREDDLVSAGIFMNQPLGVVYDYNIIGMWQIDDYNNGVIPNNFTYGTYKIEDIDNDGSYTPDKDRRILGYTDPDFYFSIQQAFRYRAFELRVFINSVQGGSQYYYGRPASAQPDPNQMKNYAYFDYDYWTPENPDAKYRQLGFMTSFLGPSFSPYVQRSFVRLQDLSLSYRLPKSLLNKIGVHNFRVFASGTNLLTITKWEGWDPEANQGFDFPNYPTLKSFTAGLNFDF
ncbi:SusC/RagA family TonB-linked outer membrane protein [Sphingobacterium haloxyli]|uniref:SusC/RagA family TonB-linked outer membrane protein n=2 Tax=Sphingobacterium haloxyli TaxID=2100533 RepID=A0A2S9J4R1_9SPHI|nr:SusC/RagA family TonB-linked outer membrane protein [Sphingobacterium haloxyli]